MRHSDPRSWATGQATAELSLHSLQTTQVQPGGTYTLSHACPAERAGSFLTKKHPEILYRRAPKLPWGLLSLYGGFGGWHLLAHEHPLQRAEGRDAKLAVRRCARGRGFITQAASRWPFPPTFIKTNPTLGGLVPGLPKAYSGPTKVHPCVPLTHCLPHRMVGGGLTVAPRPHPSHHNPPLQPVGPDGGGVVAARLTGAKGRATSLVWDDMLSASRGPGASQALMPFSILSFLVHKMGIRNQTHSPAVRTKCVIQCQVSRNVVTEGPRGNQVG